MLIDKEALRSLSQEEKREPVEMLWDDLGRADASIPLPEWADRLGAERRGDARPARWALARGDLETN